MKGEFIITKTIFKYIMLIVGIFSVSVLSYSGIISRQFPDSFYVRTGQALELGSNITGSDELTESSDVRAMHDMVQVGEKTVQLRYKGILPIKNVNVEYIDEINLIPCGTAFGVKMETDGVVVVGVGDVDGENGLVSPAGNAGIKVGDIIMLVNGIKVRENKDIADIVSASGGEDVIFSVRRKEMGFELTLKPEKSTVDQTYKGGLWVRDSSAGIGTMTFYDPATGIFGGLGHPICDVETGDILPLMEGHIEEVEITGINKGINGIPGELRGVFSKTGSSGELLLNTESGVFGVLDRNPPQNSIMPLGLRQEVTRGDAVIMCTLGLGEPEEYSIYIESVDISGANLTKNMVIHITDPRLLETTGGIVQGMSGSPIIQGGKIVGAVTHVFVNDPTKGYGIFAENMIKTSSKIVIDRAS